MRVPALTDAAAERARLAPAQFRRLEVLLFVEGATLVLLVGLAVPLKHLAGWPMAAAIVGPVHGLALLAYFRTAVETVAGGGWRRSDAAQLFVLALVPFGGVVTVALVQRRAAGPVRRGQKVSATRPAA